MLEATRPLNPNIEHSKEYKRRINSADWRKLRKQLIDHCDSVCERCHKKSNLELHHKNYERLWAENRSDLELVCEACHIIADQERKKLTEERRDDAIYANARTTYFMKKDGEANLGRQTPQDYQAFDEWLRDKRENNHYGE